MCFNVGAGFQLFQWSFETGDSGNTKKMNKVKKLWNSSWELTEQEEVWWCYVNLSLAHFLKIKCRDKQNSVLHWYRFSDGFSICVLTDRLLVSDTKATGYKYQVLQEHHLRLVSCLLIWKIDSSQFFQVECASPRITWFLLLHDLFAFCFLWPITKHATKG